MKDTDGLALFSIIFLFILMLLPIPTELFLIIISIALFAFGSLYDKLDNDPKQSGKNGLTIFAAGIYAIVGIISMIMLFSS